MVVPFSSIPPHIQKNVIEKMDVEDFRQFLQSSKKAYKMDNVVKVAMDVDWMNYNEDSDGLRFDKFLWSTVKSNVSCPRFIVKNMNFFEDSISAKEITEIIREAEEGCFSGKNMKWNFYPDEKTMGPDLFSRFLQVFNVTNFDDQTEHTMFCLDARYLKHLKSNQIKEITLTTPFPIEELVGLKAPTMKICITSTKINSSLNQLFKEWFYNQREIEYVRLVIIEYHETPWENISPEEIFSGLSYTIQWSPETHDSSILSKLTLEELWWFKDNKFYSIGNNGNHLFIGISTGDVEIIKISKNPEEHLVESLDGFSYEKLTGVCKCCMKTECDSSDYDEEDSSLDKAD